MTIDEFNQLPAAEAKTLVQHCANIPCWCTQLVAARPYASMKALYYAAENAAAKWQWTEIYDALKKHPRIGESRAQTPLSAAETAFSRYEQAAMTRNKTTQEQLSSANAAYEKRFGYVFLIRAKDRSSEEILHQLYRRLQNDALSEQLEVKRELTEIALLRLTTLFTE